MVQTNPAERSGPIKRLFHTFQGTAKIAALLSRDEARTDKATRSPLCRLLGAPPGVAARMLTKDEARRIEANFAKLPELAQRKSPGA